MPPTLSSAEPVPDLRTDINIFCRLLQTLLLLLLHARSVIKEPQFQLWEAPMMMISNH